MQTEALVLVTVVAEAVVEHRLVRDVEAAGAHGWTVCDARGQGSRGIRASEFEGSNIRLETLVSAEVADRFLEVLARDYFPRYAVVAWTTSAQVVRAAKYM
jgi:nitrogen regulatory protein P-II 2